MRFRISCLAVLLAAALLLAPATTGAQAPAAKGTPRGVSTEKKATPAAAAAAPSEKALEERRNADRLFNAGKTEEAKAIYLKLSPSFPDDFELNKRLAYCYFVSPKREMDRAARYYARAHQMNPKDAEVERNLGKAYSWSKQYAAAIGVFRRILARESNNAEILLDLARAQSWGGQAEAARTTYQSYLKRWPGDRSARLEYAALLSYNKQPEAALQEYRAILKADPNNQQARLGEAQVLAWQGKLQESLDAYDLILQKSPKNYDAIRGKAFALLWLQRYEEAATLFAQANKMKPGDTEVQDGLKQIARWKADEPSRRAQADMDALRQQVDAAMAKNDIARGIELIKQMIARAPQDWRHRFRLGQAYSWNRQWDDAIATFEKLRTEQPDNMDVLKELANAQTGANRLADAAATYRAVLQRSPDTYTRISLGRVLTWSGKLDEGVAAYREILQSDPENFDATLGLAQALAWQGQHQASIELYDAALKRRPGHRDALLGRALVLSWSGSPDKAVGALESMRQTWPDDREIATALQSVRETEKQRAAEREVARTPVDIDERIKKYQETLVNYPNSLQVLQRLAELYAQKQDFAQAVSFYERALAQNPGDRDLRLQAARVASWAKDFPRSIKFYQSLFQDEPRNREYRIELAKILSWAGRNTESVEQYREALKIDPNNVEARLGLARVLSWNKQLDESVAEYTALLEQDPRNRDAFIERARVYSWKGELDTAINLYEEILIRNPEDRDARFGKAQSLYWAGRAREAKGILTDMQVKHPKDTDVKLTAAGVQAALGRRDLALRQLEEIEKLQPGHTDTEAMRRSIRQDLRPTLILGFTPSVDSFELGVYSSTAQLHFSPTPAIRSYVFAGIIPSEDPVFGSATGREFLFGSSGRVTDWLLLRGEIGANSSVTGRDGTIGGGGATFFVNDKMQFDFDASRRYVNSIPRPVRLNISRAQFRLGWDWRPELRTSFHIDYYHQRYSDTNQNNGANFSLMRKLVRREAFELDTGYLYSAFGFTKDLNSGFFAPSRFQRHAALGNIRAKLSKKMGLMFWGSLGSEQISPDPYRLDGSARVGWEFIPSEHFRFSLGYGYFATSSIARSGGYITHTGYLTLEFRY